MIEGFLIEHPLVAVAIWMLLYVSDYYLTLWGAVAYRRDAHKYIDLGGSYELEEVFQKDVDALRRLSPKFVLALLLTSAVLLAIWWLSVRGAHYPAFFVVAFGALALTELVVHLRHVRNILFFRALAKPGAVAGHLKYSRWVTEQLSIYDVLGYAVLFAICFLLSGQIFFVGGVLGCLGLTRRHLRTRRLRQHDIRRVRRADAAAIAQIHVESWKVAYRGIVADDVIARTDLSYRTQFWKDRIADSDWPVFAIKQGHRYVAFCHMIASRDEDVGPGRVGQITSIHVLPELRGRGHGRALVDRVIAEFKTRGFQEVTLWVLEANHQARRFYEKYGFSLDTGQRTLPSTNVPEVRYRIRIS